MLWNILDATIDVIRYLFALTFSIMIGLMVIGLCILFIVSIIVCIKSMIFWVL